MTTAQILVGILVGWASAVCWSRASVGNIALSRVIGVVGGLIGTYLAVTIGSGEPLAVAIWAWAGSVILSDIVSMATPNRA